MRTYLDAEAVSEIAKRLIPKYHSELATARIRYVFVDKGGKKGGKAVFGKARRISGVLEFMLELDFLVEVALDSWNDLSDTRRSALVDHLLSRCWGEESEDDPGAGMVWSIKEPDVSEFADIIQRHGAWTDDLRNLQNIMSVSKEVDFPSIVRKNSKVETSSAMAS